MSRNPVTEPGRRCQPRPLAAAARGGARKNGRGQRIGHPVAMRLQKGSVSLGRDKGDGKKGTICQLWAGESELVIRYDLCTVVTVTTLTHVFSEGQHR
jgi:hypothetical protein